MRIFKALLYTTIILFIAIMFFENDAFFLGDYNLKLNLRAWKFTFPPLKLITLLFLFFTLGYFFSYYLNIKKNYKRKKEIEYLKNELSKKNSETVKIENKPEKEIKENKD